MSVSSSHGQTSPSRPGHVLVERKFWVKLKHYLDSDSVLYLTSTLPVTLQRYYTIKKYTLRNGSPLTSPQSPPCVLKPSLILSSLVPNPLSSKLHCAALPALQYLSAPDSWHCRLVRQPQMVDRVLDRAPNLEHRTARDQPRLL